MIIANDLDGMVFALLNQYGIVNKKQVIETNIIYEVPQFGTKIAFMDGQHFDKKLLDGWHVAYVFPDFDFIEARDKVIWTLVKGGYFHYLRNNFKNTFNRMLHSEGWDKALVDHRKKSYKDLPKFAYWKDLNSKLGGVTYNYAMSIDPGFFDIILE
jgi:hypothetical protein